MPNVSEAQRGAMAAAAEGKSTLGIPAKVGKEFMDADQGGKLPAKAPAPAPKLKPKPKKAKDSGKTDLLAKQGLISPKQATKAKASIDAIEDEASAGGGDIPEEKMPRGKRPD